MSSFKKLAKDAKELFGQPLGETDKEELKARKQQKPEPDRIADAKADEDRAAPIGAAAPAMQKSQEEELDKMLAKDDGNEKEARKYRDERHVYLKERLHELESKQIDELLPLLKDKETITRLCSAIMLGERMEKSDSDTRRKAALALIRGLEDLRPEVRVATAEALGKTEDEAAISPLFASLKGDPSEDVKREAKKALKRIKGIK